MNAYFDHIYVINLSRQTDRLIKVLLRFYKLNIRVEVIPAIDGYISPHINNYKKYVSNAQFLKKHSRGETDT